MKPIVKTAIILAAGKGVRLDRVGEHIPKGFTCMADKPIIERSIQQLITQGIEKIYLVTGHHADYYEELQKRYKSAIELVHNDQYAESGSMYSLYQMKDIVRRDFLLLESDILYETQALRSLLNHESKDVVLCSGETGMDDAVFVATKNNCLLGMSKQRDRLEGEIFGELVGICKISQALFQHMIDIAGQHFQTSLIMDYETDCLVQAAVRHAVTCHRETDLLWCEIDNFDHLLFARNKVYPAIVKAEQSPLEKLHDYLRRTRMRLRRWRKSLRKPTSLTGTNYRFAKKMLLDVCQMFNESDIRYMVDQGTLIGIARDGDLLPWDDDVDIALPNDQLPKVQALLPRLKSMGYQIRFRYMFYPFRAWKEGDLQCIKIRTVRWALLRSRFRMDINIKYPDSGQYFWHSMGNTCKTDARHFDDFETIEYDSHQLRVPADYSEYLSEKYGDWMTPDREYVPRKLDGTTIGRIAVGRTRR